MLISNLENFGGAFGSHFFDLISDKATRRVRIVSGYVSKDVILKTAEALSENHQISFELVVGMAVKEGLSQGVYDALVGLNSQIRNGEVSANSRSGVYGFFSGPEGQRDRGMHAKAYLFDRENDQKLIVGSSNFSFSGLNKSGNVEMNLTTADREDISVFEAFYEGLHSGHNAVPLNLIDNFPIRGSAARNRREAIGALKVRPPSGFKAFPFVEIDLSRNIENQQKSNLNAFFGKGRWSRGTGVVRPRDWYEVELIVPKEITSNPEYPKGNFMVTTTDGWRFEASAQGDYEKNLRSTHDLKILGMWLKGLLEDKGALSQDPYEMVTADTFANYGNSIMRIYRVGKNEVVLNFPQNQDDL